MSSSQLLTRRSIINPPADCMLISPMTYSPKERKSASHEACPRVFSMAYAPTLLHRSGGRIGQHAVGTLCMRPRRIMTWPIYWKNFPAVHATFNFTPSLLLQLQEIGDGNVRDLFLEHAQRPAADLTPEEKAFLIRHFFSANWATMVRPYPRYHELLVKRGSGHHRGRISTASRASFPRKSLLDLQVWHNLAWFGYGTVQRYPRLARCARKIAASPRTISTKSWNCNGWRCKKSSPCTAGSWNGDKSN